MAAIRVKRRLDEEPLEALILNCKRKKTEQACKENAEDHSTILKFAGTSKDPDEDIFKYIKQQTKEELEDCYKKHKVNIHEKLKEEVQTTSKNSRYKVVNCRRSLDQNVPDEDKVTIFDIETDDKQHYCTEASTSDYEKDSDEPEYVYDVYTCSDDFGDADLNEVLSVYPLSYDQVYNSTRNAMFGNSDSEESDDSNAETNWRNDYPDESDMESVTEEDMLTTMNKMTLNGDNELSSDDCEENFVYGIDQAISTSDLSIDQDDVDKHGEMYARFKAKHKEVTEAAVIDNNFYYGDIDEDEYYY